MTLEEFQAVVDEVVSNLPREFFQRLSNVEIVAEAWPSAEDLESVDGNRSTVLFGLYRGVPQTRRSNYSGVLPDKIAIFAGPIIRNNSTISEIRSQVRSTVLHEIGHHFGMDEEQIRKAEKERSS